MAEDWLTLDFIVRRFSNFSVECGALGLIWKGREIPEPLRCLEAGDFSYPLNQAIYEAMCALQARGHPIDVGLLAHQMCRDGTSDELRGESLLLYLDKCLNLCPTSEVEETHVQQLIDLAGKRRLWLEALLFARALGTGKWDDLPAEKIRATWCARLGQIGLARSGAQSATWADLEGQVGPIEWDWPGWLARGFVTLLAGEAGMGKSILALRLCACYLRGDDWPDGTPCDGASPPCDALSPASDALSPGGTAPHVLWCETEAAQAINWQRARSWGLPLDRILTPLGPLEDVSLDVPAHQAAIARIAGRPEVRLVVVDSLSGASRRGENAGAGHAAVRWLAALARDTGKPVLLLHHLRKRGLLDAGQRVRLERLRGHSSIVQPARTVLALDAPDPGREALRRLSVIKSNLAPWPEPLGLWVTAGGDRPGAGRGGAPGAAGGRAGAGRRGTGLPARDAHRQADRRARQGRDGHPLPPPKWPLGVGAACSQIGNRKQGQLISLAILAILAIWPRPNLKPVTCNLKLETGNPMLLTPDDLTSLYLGELYNLLDDLAAFRRAYGRGRTPEAAHARQACAAERARVKAELRRRGLRGTRSGDRRVYGPGRAPWQRAGE